MEMGEAAPCLVRSFSQPFSASCEYKEGDPLRALTTSISFGRFMTEPLDWEKWSSFSHNRTLEDVQKYSKPGSVAEKKAFFEAHYKQIATKKAAKSPKKENKALNYSPETNVTTDVSPITISMKLDPTRSNTHSAIDDTLGNESPKLATNLVFSHIDEYMLSNRQVEQEIASIEDVCSPSTGQVFSKIGDADDNISSTGQVEQEKASTEDVPSPSTNLVFSQFGNVNDDVLSTGQVEQEKASTKNASLKNHQFQVEISNQSSHVDKNKKAHIKDAASDGDKISGQTKPEISSSKSSSKNGAYKLQSPRKAPTPPIRPRKAARYVMEKKRSAPKSLHMSMNFSPARESSGMYSSPFANKSGTSKTIGKPEDRLTQEALARVPVNGVPKNSQLLPRPESRRSKTLLDCSVNGSRTVVMKSLSTNHSEASSACTKKPRSSTVPSSFSFRSEERAEKRKEFFQKLEEKGNSKEEKIQLQPILKEKARNDNKKLRWSTALEAKPSTSETKAPSNSMQKVNNYVRHVHEKASDHKKLCWSTALEAKSSTSEAKAPSNSMQKVNKYVRLVQEKARNDHKKLRWSTALEAKPNTSETKAPCNSMQKVNKYIRLVQEKDRNDNKKVRWCTALEAKPSTSETKAPSNSMQKVPPTRPCSPMLGRKSTSRLVQDTCYQSPWRSSSKPKNFIEINKKKLSSSMASLLTKKMHENVSPNTQR